MCINQEDVIHVSRLGNHSHGKNKERTCSIDVNHAAGVKDLHTLKQF